MKKILRKLARYWGFLMNTASEDWQNNVNMKLDRILNDVDFIKNRTSIFLGRNEVLTFLPDETPVFVNSDDYGCPLNFINGGFYEEENFTVFLSFREPQQAVLDIGANLGVYSLRMASYLRRTKIHSFEPIPKVRKLFSRSSFLNGFDDRIQIHPFAASDKEGTAKLNVPDEHAGGAAIDATGGGGGIEIETRRVDSLFADDFSCGLVKIDVEGHELHALNGMRGILSRSHQCAVLFEKLGTDSGIERDLFALFTDLGWTIYGIEGHRLTALELSTFVSKGGYFVAAPAEHVSKDGLDRNFFKIFPSDVNAIEAKVEDGKLEGDASGNSRSVIFHGPYWYLPRGYYRLTFDGVLSAPVTLDICEKFGFKVLEVTISPEQLSVEFPIYRDLTKFEVVMRTIDSSRVTFSMNSIKFTRIG